ncbi:hypothetical protein MPDQ_002331 [Monascus purpureus]|uniref:Prefoldin subunit 1 n=1 Tax=Monascus purpureus TaxID=5098 RepID=A0A507QMP4_MONPU|nr:hypothetical protein MPDQ_002331 [Monascus purpureus]BDD58487.1 hypothetical protein MAP00_003762 [Monascus purpureus]
MSIPNEALQKVVQEIETRAIQSQQQIAIVKAQITAKQRETRLLELTSKEISTLPKDTKTYEGVGKMFVRVPLSTIEKQLSTQSANMKSNITDLEKKLHYHETTHKNTRENIEHIFKSASRA